MNVNTLLHAIGVALAICACVLPVDGIAEDHQRLVFRNGDSLRGELQQLDHAKGLFTWRYPRVRDGLSFPIHEVAYVDLGNGTGAVEPDFILGLVTGDRVPVKLSQVDREFVYVILPWGERASLPRKSILFGQRLPGLSEPILNGIIAEDWSVGDRGENWIARENELVSRAYSSTRADLKIPEVASVRLDLTFPEDPSLNIFLCADESRDGGAHLYYLQFTPSGISAQRQHGVSPRKYTSLKRDRELSDSTLKALAQPDVRITLFLNRPKGEIHLFVNDEKAITFTDTVTPASMGSSILLASLSKGEVRLRDVSVQTWDGLGMDEISSLPSSQPRVSLSSGIRNAALESLSEGTLKISGSAERISISDLRSFRWPEMEVKRLPSLRAYFAPSGFIDFEKAAIQQGSLIGKHPVIGACNIPLTELEVLVVNPTGDMAVNESALGDDILQFRNGDRLHGRIGSWSPSEGLEWMIPKYDQVVVFPDHEIWKIGLGGEAQPAPIQQATVTLLSGIEIPGKLIELSDSSLSLETHFSEPMQIDRSAVRRLDLRNPEHVRYAGPREGETWVTSSNERATWDVVDGVLQTSVPGHAGREIDWPDKVRLDVSLEWEGFLSGSISWFTQRPNEPLSPYGYTLQCDHASFTLLRGDREPVEEGAEDGIRNARLDEQLRKFHAQYSGVSLKRLGSPVPVKDLALNGQAKFTLCMDRTRGEIDLFVNGQWIRHWEDPEGVSPEAGNGLVFSQQGSSSTLRVLEVRVSEWNGAMPRSVEASKDPAVAKLVLENEDELEGTLSTIREGQMHVVSALGEILISQELVRTIFFETKNRPAEPVRKGMVVEGLFRRSGNALFFLDRIADEILEVSSPYHADNQLHLRAFRELRFDLQDRLFWMSDEVPRTAPTPVALRPWLLE